MLREEAAKLLMMIQGAYPNYKPLDKTAKSTKKATKAAKDYLSPLDEINRYTTNKDTDTAPSGSDVNGTPTLYVGSSTGEFRYCRKISK